MPFGRDLILPTGERRRDSLADLYRQHEFERLYGMLQTNRELYSGRVKEFSRQVVPKEEYENFYAPDRSDVQRWKKQDIADTQTSGPLFNKQVSGYWGKDSDWQQLNPYQKAAAMALLEADVRDGRPDFGAARNVLGAMINRADKDGMDLGDHVSGKKYQPTIEPSQYARLPRIIQLPEFKALTDLAQQRDQGQVPDWVNGSTHFLAHEPVMESLQAQEPDKYRTWVGWSGYNRGGGQYTNPDGSPVLRDRSHAFLAPEGRHSADRGPLVDVEGQGSAMPSRSPPLGEDVAGNAIPGAGGYDKPAYPQNEYTSAAQVASSPVGGKIPTLSEFLWGSNTPLIGSLMGDNATPPRFRNPLADQASEKATAIQLPQTEQIPNEDQSAFQANEPTRRRLYRRQT